jgi:hypothetical protein
LAFEERIGRQVDIREAIVNFIPEYSAYLINRLEIGKDGKTAYERTKGKKATVLGLEFGEKVLYKVKKEAKMAKARSRWEHAIFVGVRRRSGEVWLSADGKVFRARSVRRIPVGERWGEDCVRWVTRVPWNRYKDCGDADGDVPQGVPAAESRSQPSAVSEPVIVTVRGRVPREFYIRKEDGEKHGYTRGCGGCSSWFKGLARQPHSEACRGRFREILKEDARVKNAETRKSEFDNKIKEQMKRKVDYGEEGGEEAKKSRAGDVEMQGGSEQVGGSSSSGGGVKRKPEDDDIEEERMDRKIEAVEAEEFEEEEVRKWVCEIKEKLEDVEEEAEVDEQEWERNDGELDPEEIAAARSEEIGFMEERKIWSLKTVVECWKVTGKPPVSVRWVDVMKADGARSRLVARDF